MNKHLSLRSGNPVLSSKTFSNSILSDNQMTIEGTVNKTAISLLLLVGTGYFTFDVVNPVLLVGCGIGGFVIAIITVFKRMGSNNGSHLCIPRRSYVRRNILHV